MEELGLDTEGMVTSTAKLREEIMALSGVDIMENENTFKSTYAIMDELSQKWEDLSDIQQATVTELIAGKRQGNVISSLMQNFDIARNALNTSLNSSGSAMKEHEKWSQSLESRLNKLKSAWQSLSQSFLNSDFLKGTLDGVIGLVDALDKLTRSFGTIGTIGFGAGIFSLIKSGGLKAFFRSFSAFSTLIPTFDTLGGKIKGVGVAIGDSARYAKKSMSSFSAWTTGIGLAVAAIGLIVQALKNYKEEQARLRQETIATSDEFLDSASSFEQAYIKYSGRTDLTAEEESELETAINGTVDALGDKSSALQKAVNSSNDYLASLESIKEAELEEANRKAQQKLKAAEGEVKDAAIGWFNLDGSEVNVKIRSSGKDYTKQEEQAIEIAQDAGKKYSTVLESNKGFTTTGFKLSGDADINEIIEYYQTLTKIQTELQESGLDDTYVFDNVTEAIGTMTESVEGYLDALAEVSKYEYEYIKKNGIPKTTEEYFKMRTSILKSLNGASFDTKQRIANELDSEYNKSFDLATTEAQARKFVGIISKYGDGTKDGTNDIGTVETFLNMRTAVNNNECTVGQYISQLDEINAMTAEYSDDERKEFNSTFSIDADKIKQQYDEVHKYLSNKDISALDDYKNTPEFRLEKDNIKEQEIKNFLDGLSAYELEAAVNLKTELDWENDSWDDILNQIEEEAKLIEAISFSVNLEIETEKLENLSTAITESVSGAGLGDASISVVEDMFGDLDGYDQSKLFERTANGIRLNSDELRKLNDEYKQTNVDGLNDKVDALGERYIQTREELSDLTYGTEEYNKKARELSDIEAQINATEKLAAQYEGLTSAYQTWQRAESAGSQRDMYESMIEGLENVDDEISRGWLDDGTIEFLRLIKGDTLSATATTKELKEAYKSLDDTIKHTTHSVRDFFTVDEDGNSTNDGVYNFLDAIGQMEEEKFGGKDVVKRITEGKDKGKIIGFDFQIVGGDKAIADALGISEELVDIMVRAADDAGFVVSMDGTYQQLDILKDKAQEAADKLKNTFKKTKFEFDLNTGDEGSVLEQYNESLKIWEEFKKNKTKDGTVDMSVEGAEEAFTLVSTLQSMVDKLSEPVYMELNTSQVEKDMQAPLNKLQEYETLTQTEHQLQLKGTDTSAIEADKKEIIDYFDELQENSPEIAAELGIEGLSREEIEKKLESGEIKIPATVDLQVEMNNTMRDMVNVALYNAGLIDKEELETRVDVKLYANEVDASKVVNDIDSVLEESKLSEEKQVTIKAFAEVFGVDNVEDLSKKLDSLTNKQIQVLAEVLGRIDVEKLKTTVEGLDDKTVEAIAKALGEGDVDGLKTTINGLDDKTVQAIAQAFGYSEVSELNGAIEDLDPKTVQAIAQALGITDVNSLKGSIDRLTGKNVDAVANVDGKSDVDNLKSSIDNLKGKTVTIWAQVKKIASNLWGKITGKGGDGDSEANGTANVNGTTGRAFKQGSWGTKNSGTALVGELGREVLVRDGRYYTIGDNGAEFIKYKKGDIIFNHVQSEELFKNGKITSGGGRAKAFASGTAFKEGSKGEGGTGKVTVSVNSNTGKSYKKSSDKSDDFEETIDLIEIALKRVQREIDNLDQKASNVYKSWGSRNTALSNQINKVGNEIALQQKAANEYLKAANGVGLSSDWVNKIKNGEIDIETIKDEAIAEKVKDYQSYYENALDCKDAIEELREEESKLYAQRVENVAAQYEGILGVIEHEKNMIEEYISQSEANAQLISGEYYKALISNENETITQLQKQKNAMLSELQTAMNSGTITKYSEGWYEIVNSIDEVTLSIAESQTQIKEWQQTIQQLSWGTFDMLQDKISAVTEEADFLIELMSSDKLHDENGKLTDEGLATMGLHGQNYNTYMYQSDQAAKEAERLKKELAKDPYDTELEERYREMIALQQEYILSAQDEKNAIRDLVSDGIELELDALQELIDKKNEELDSERDLYEYQKKVLEQTKEISSLEKQIASYSGDDSEEAKAKIQELKVSLEEAKTDLEETEYDKYISDQNAMLDELYLSYEEVLNTRLDNLDALVSDMIAQINTDAISISTTLSEKADSVGYTLSDSMTSIWDTNSTKINGVITTYGERFTSAQTTTNNALSTINTNLQNMISQLNVIAKTNTKSASTSSAANDKKADTPKPSTTQKQETPKTPSTPTVKVGGMVNASGAQIYDYAGDTSGERQLYRNDPKYKVLKEDGNWIQVRWHKLSSGITGWFKKGDVKALATGARRIVSDDVAWTQEKGQELIVRPSDGAILTPVAKGDSVLNATASGNIWNMANNPAEFIKNNLGLDAANVPNGSNVNNTYSQHIDNVVFRMDNIKNYDEMIAQMQKDKNFERLVLSMSIDRLAGKSGLAKGKSIR